MSGIVIAGAGAADVIQPDQYFRAVWQGFPSSFLWAGDNAPTIAAQLYDDIRAGTIDYVTPIEQPGTVPGARVIAIDLQTFTPNTVTTVAQLATALNALRISASLFSLTRVQAGDVYGSGASSSRDATTQAATAAVTSQSVLAKLGDEARMIALGVLVIVALMLILGAHKVIKRVT